MVPLARASGVAPRSRPFLLTACCSLALVGALSGCGLRPGAEAPLPKPSRNTPAETAATEGRRRQSLQRCRASRDTLQDALAALRRDEARLAAIRAESFAPETPPPSFDEDAAARLTREDAELDRERHDTALQQWQDRNAQRQRSWQERHSTRLNAAQAALDQRAATLHRLHPRLFSAPGSIEVVPAELARLSQCEPLPGRPRPDQPQKQASR